MCRANNRAGKKQLQPILYDEVIHRIHLLILVQQVMLIKSWQNLLQSNLAGRRRSPVTLQSTALALGTCTWKKYARYRVP